MLVVLECVSQQMMVMIAPLARKALLTLVHKYNGIMSVNVTKSLKSVRNHEILVGMWSVKMGLALHIT